MAETPRNESSQEGAADLLGAARDRGMEHLEGAKGQLAEGAERVASAVERTAEELDGEGDGAISGFGHSVASLMRQLAGGLRERDVEEFAHELGALARRNPGVFLAGSVALGFGIARFFRARAPDSSMGASNSGDYGWRDTGGWQDTAAWNASGDSARGTREEFDADESLDLSASSSGSSGLSGSQSDLGSSQDGTATQQGTSRDDDRNPSKARQSGKQKAKPQRASSSGSQQGGAGSQGLSSERSATEPAPTGDSSGPGSGGSAFTGGTGGGAPRGGKS